MGIQTRQFKAGNSQAVRIPADMAFPPDTEVTVTREGDRIIIEPVTARLNDLTSRFASLVPWFEGGRPGFEEVERDWS